MDRLQDLDRLWTTKARPRPTVIELVILALRRMLWVRR